MSCDLEATNESACCYEKNSSFAILLSYRRLHFPYWWRVTTKIWVVRLIGWSKFTTSWISALAPQTSFGGKTSSFVSKCWLFSQVMGYLKYFIFFYIHARLVILSSALEISSQSGVIPARTSQKITATAYPSRRIAYKFKLSYELLSMFGMYALVNPGPFSFSVLCSV